MFIPIGFLLLFCFVGKAVALDVNCTRFKDSQLWVLAWASEFDSPTELTEKWSLQHETTFCSQNGIQQVNCNTRNNVNVSRGYAFLVAKREDYKHYNYTGATMTANATFSYGRYEVRARFPRGNYLRPSIFTRNDSEPYWHDYGQFDIANYLQDQRLFRGIHYAHSSFKYSPRDIDFITLYDAQVKLTYEFHLYGIEWSENRSRFFWDDQYTDWSNFTTDLAFTPFHQIRLQIGVGGNLFPKKVPTVFKANQMKWVCPALIVDYVRVYRPVNNRSLCTRIIRQTEVTGSSAETIQVDELCEAFRAKEKDDDYDYDYTDNEKLKVTVEKTFMKSKPFPQVDITDTVSLSAQWIIVSMVVLFVLAVVWMVYQLRSVREKLDTAEREDDSPLGTGLGRALASMPKPGEEELYEEVDYAEAGSPEVRYIPYLKLDEAYPTASYLAVNDATVQYDSIALPVSASSECAVLEDKGAKAEHFQAVHSESTRPLQTAANSTTTNV